MDLPLIDILDALAIAYKRVCVRTYKALFTTKLLSFVLQYSIT